MKIVSTRCGPQLLNDVKPGKYEKELRSLPPEPRQSLGVFIDSHAAAIKNMANWAAGLVLFCGTPAFALAAKAQNLVHACLNSAAADSCWENV